MEIDLSALGTVNTAIAALFSKLGVPIRTAVAAGVLEAAYDGRFSASPLHFGQRVQDRVEKQAARFYELEVSQVGGWGRRTLVCKWDVFWPLADGPEEKGGMGRRPGKRQVAASRR